jgi:hypothetical protein
MKQTVAERFWSKVDKSGGPEACWPWTAAIDKSSGYGLFAVAHGELVGAHVYAFRAEGGSVPARSCVLHSCDNRPCCNPQHLSAGTKKENYDDSVSKGRQTRGEKVHNAKLTEETVREIRKRFVKGNPINGGAALAVLFGVNQSTVNKIARGQLWPHVL